MRPKKEIDILEKIRRKKLPLTPNQFHQLNHFLKKITGVGYYQLLETARQIGFELAEKVDLTVGEKYSLHREKNLFKLLRVIQKIASRVSGIEEDEI